MQHMLKLSATLLGLMLVISSPSFASASLASSLVSTASFQLLLLPLLVLPPSYCSSFSFCSPLATTPSSTTPLQLLLITILLLHSSYCS